MRNAHLQTDAVRFFQIAMKIRHNRQPFYRKCMDSMNIRHSWTSGYKGNLLALVAGAIFPLGFAPLSWWPLSIISLALFIPLLDGQTGKRSLLRGWLFGFGMHAVGVSWVYISINTYGHTPQGLAILLTGLFAAGLALFIALFAWSYQRLGLDKLYWLTFPSWWVLFEWIKSWLLSGFPWLYAGNAFIDTPLEGLAPITGVLGISWVVALTAALIYLLISRPAKLRVSIATIAIVWACAYGLQQQTWVTPSMKNALNIAIIQGNIPQEKKWDPKERDNIIGTYLANTEANWGKDLIIWPEAALPVFYQEVQDLIQRLNLQAKDNNSAIISGTPYWQTHEGRYQYFNSIFAIGHGQGIYHKQRLVPFGEYVPMEDAIRGLIPFFDLPMSSFTRGGANQQPLLAAEATFAPFICYEIVYPELVRTMGNKSDYLITISNDAWFGTSWGPDQHFEIARMRALEMGKYLIRGTNTGLTAIIDHRGDVQSKLPRFEEAVLTGTVYSTQGVTPYSQIGWWPTLGLSALLSLFGVVRGRRVRSIE